MNTLANRKGTMAYGASLMKVFMPYLVWNTVFDNTRVTTELGTQAGAILAIQLSLTEIQPRA